MASDYCHDQELRVALERHDERSARVVPVIVRAVDWSLSDFSKLQVVPRGGGAITSSMNLDEAWAEVSKEIRSIVQEITAQKVAEYLKQFRTINR